MDDGTTHTKMVKRKLEIDLFSFQGEKHDLERKKENIQNERDRLEKEMDRLKSEMTELKATENNYDHQIIDAENEIVRIKRKMNNL